MCKERIEIELKLVLWGAGAFGRRIFNRISDQVVAIIDGNPEKIGTDMEGAPIIDYEEYERLYSQYFILVTPLINKDIITFLHKKNNYKYFLATDLPGEWFDYNERKGYKDYLFSLIDSNQTALIYGCNYHAVLMREIIKERTGQDVLLVANKSENTNVIREIEKNIGTVISLEEAENAIAEVIYIATGNDIDDLSNLKGKKIETWDCKDIIAEYHHPELMKYKNIHQGEKCVIVGNGPSLKISDLNVLYDNDVVTFGMNKIYELFYNTPWRPTYYVSGDVNWLSSGNLEGKMKNDDFKMMFITDRLNEDIFSEYNHCIYHMQAEVPSDRIAKFSRDIVNGLYYGATVLYNCLQIAVYMGFSKIYLLGVDFTGGATGEKTEYCNFDGKPNGGHLFNQIIYHGYLAAKKEADKGGFQIYNATRGGELEVFKRVEFDSLFGKNKNI